MLNFYRFRQDYLKFVGNDRLDLINRLSTNQVNTLQQYSGIKTVLTNDKGRFVDLITLYNFGDFVFSTCSFNNAPNVMAHLDNYTIMDDFKPVNLTGTHESILFLGNDTDNYAKEKFGIELNSLNNNDLRIIKISGCDAIAAGNDNQFRGLQFIYESKDKATWDNFLLPDDQKRKYCITELNDEQFEIERIAFGVPAFGKEMTEHTNPLECGLNSYVSFTKGCYIGQEVIARLDAYDKISKHLIKIESADEIAQGDRIITDNKECGFVSSAVKISDGSFKGLGFIKTIFLDFNKQYQIKNNQQLLSCRIRPLYNQ